MNDISPDPLSYLSSFLDASGWAFSSAGAGTEFTRIK